MEIEEKFVANLDGLVFVERDGPKLFDEIGPVVFQEVIIASPLVSSPLKKPSYLSFWPTSTCHLPVCE